MGKEDKRRRTQLTAELATIVENRMKRDVESAKAKVKQSEATQAGKPTEDKFLSAKELAQMAGVTPTVLRKCLRNNSAGRIPRAEGSTAYQVKASDPLVQEIIAKVK